MANVVEKFGLRPYKNLNGASWNNAQNRYTIANNYGTAIFQGDMVIPVTAGNIERHTAGNATPIVGVFNGCFYTDPTTKKPTFSNHNPGSIAADDIVAYVAIDPFIIMQMQCDGAADQDDLGKNCAVVQTAGSTSIGTSKNAVDISTVATTNTLPVKIIEFVDGPDSAVGDSYTDVLVMFNAGHQLLNSTGVG